MARVAAWKFTAVIIINPMNTFALPDASLWQGATPLSQLAPILAEGPDAASFLHGQLSQDVLLLPEGQARHAAYCSVKGRMLADFLMFKAGPDQILLLLDAEVLPATLKRLSMFVMRAKAKLSDASAPWAVLGGVGASTLTAFGGTAAQEPHSVRPGAHGGWVVRLPDVLGAVRSLWVGPREASDGLLAALPSLPDQVWSWLEVMSGVARIQLPTVDQFVPQMINFEVIGGVNFKKGCYPGQEIVARSQYRGTLKRRLHLAHCNALASVGQEVFSADDPGQPAGLVANAAPIPGGQGCSVLMELKLAHAGSALSLGAPDGPSLSVDALPYEIPPQDA